MTGICPARVIGELVGRCGVLIRQGRLRLRPVLLSDGDFWEATGMNPGDLRGLLPNMPCDPDRLGELADLVMERYPGSARRAVARANSICEHKFDLLGSGEVEVDPLDWHRDFKNGFDWDPRRCYTGTWDHVTTYLRRGISADVKVPWELSRFQHSTLLGRAYLLTGDGKYAREFRIQVEDWIANNPVGLGVNWACTMDVAIRALNWVWGYLLLRGSSLLTDEFLTRLLKSLYLHGRFIASHLEVGSYGNHYVADLVGLVALGSLFPGVEADLWLEDGMRRIEGQIVRQVGGDGVHLESSISYHRLVAEAFATSMTFASQAGTGVSPEYRSRLGAMMEFVRHYTKPDSLSPVIGDADDGRIQAMSERDVRNHSYLPDLGAILLGRPGLACNPGLDEEVIWLLGPDSPGRYPSGKLKEPPLSRGFPVGGFYVMREGDLYMIVRCGRPQPGAPGGHAHCDQFSFELHGGGRTFIVDPGTYLYTQSASWRNLFRSSAYHNTVVVDGGEMNGFDERDLFKLEFRSGPKVHSWVSCDRYDFLDAEHLGYSRGTEKVVHRRQVLFDKVGGAWCIRDVVSGTETHRCDFVLHLAPLPLESLGVGDAGLVLGGGRSRLAVKQLGKHSDELRITKGWISPSYGVKEEAPVVTLSREGSVITFEILFKLIVEDQAEPDPVSGSRCLEIMDRLEV